MKQRDPFWITGIHNKSLRTKKKRGMTPYLCREAVRIAYNTEISSTHAQRRRNYYLSVLFVFEISHVSRQSENS